MNYDKIFKLAQQLEQAQLLERTTRKKELEDLRNILLQIRKCALDQQKPETAKPENIQHIIDYTTLSINKLQKSLQQMEYLISSSDASFNLDLIISHIGVQEKARNLRHIFVKSSPEIIEQLQKKFPNIIIDEIE